jgi:formiminotetrahydrofolate cyclodeaminase
VAALGAALGEMVCNYTVRKGEDPESEQKISDALSEFGILRHRFLELAVEDERAFASYSAASSLPRGTDAERRVRGDAVEKALHEAADAPLNVAKGCLQVLELLIPVAANGNKNLISDAAIAALFAEASLRSAIVNVQVNARNMKGERAESLLTASAGLEKAGRLMLEQILETIDRR